MREIRVYQPGQYGLGDELYLDEGAAHHVGIVLRMKTGDQLTLFNGQNQEFKALIIESHKKKLRVSIQSMQAVNRESPLAIQLLPAVIKGERMEWVIQKAVELGVTTITPVLTEHCAVRQDAEKWAKKQQQWQAIAVAACEQSERNFIPIIHPVSPLFKILPCLTEPLKLSLHPDSQQTWHSLPSLPQAVAMLIGPEGGLSPAEVLALEKEKFVTISIGPRILRAETAALAALSLLQYLGGDI